MNSDAVSLDKNLHSSSSAISGTNNTSVYPSEAADITSVLNMRVVSFFGAMPDGA
jgi:hypothetical protein